VLARLAPLRGEAEIIVADGGSEDATAQIARPMADRVVDAPRGRARQMNAGAAVAKGDVLVFLHADTILPDGAPTAIREGLEATLRPWGRFDVAIASADPLLAAVATLMNLRSRWSGIATGDQAIFVLRERLRALAAPICLRDRVVTSARRWERHGVLRTIVLMWRLRFAYAMGVDPHSLARRYDVERSSS
jgi:glycosyltransferase involved in cell wall biosynthesis